MEHDAATIQCPNQSCQFANPVTDNFCQKCGMSLPKRYLWAIGKAIANYEPGSLIGKRYWLKSEQIVLDTKPGLLPELPDRFNNDIAAYLRLFPYRLHVPQVFGCISVGKEKIWLLEEAPIGIRNVEPTPFAASRSDLMPRLVDAFGEATPLRQLNWLWQIAQLWIPFRREGVAASLIDENLLRVEGSIVRLLELQSSDSPVHLVDLGRVWSAWSEYAQPVVRPFLEQLAQDLQQGRITNAEQLVAVLDRAIPFCSPFADTTSRQISVAASTDTGPSRQRNEDACYPPNGSFLDQPEAAITIVCDGIGGHAGGDIASHIAIDTIGDRMKQLPPYEQTNESIATYNQQIHDAVCEANNLIGERNNSEHRRGRQRMGTTLVMALVHGHEVNITHVGDSRAYLITRQRCYQITLDDDVASRDVRLGYCLYRHALRQMSSGALVQALGTNSVRVLHPTIQRLILDEDCVFLLCSDGLSDNDLVEEYWESELLPVLEGKVDPKTAVDHLIQISNFQNGHDNVTVSVLACQANASDFQVDQLLGDRLLEQLNSIPDLQPVAEVGSPKNSPTSPTAADPAELQHSEAKKGYNATVQKQVQGSHPAPTTELAPPEPDLDVDPDADTEPNAKGNNSSDNNNPCEPTIKPQRQETMKRPAPLLPLLVVILLLILGVVAYAQVKPFQNWIDTRILGEREQNEDSLSSPSSPQP
jgi:serine/threonine protein phosphatase PrpC